VAHAAWQAALLSCSADAHPQRMLLAALSTLSPAPEAQRHLLAILQASSLPTSRHALRLLADGSLMMQALTHVRSLLAPFVPLAHEDALHAAPTYLPLNHAVHQAVELLQDAQPLLAAWHAALGDALHLQRERQLLSLTSGESTEIESDLREHVLQRPDIDITFVRRVFALLDACAALLDVWETHVCVQPTEPASACVLPSLVPQLRDVMQVAGRIEQLVAGEKAQSSALAVAFEMLQTALQRLAREEVPLQVRLPARELLEAWVDGLVRDASAWARLWALGHPVTLADAQARALEHTLRLHLAGAVDRDSGAVDMVIEALAMLLATAGRKDHRLVVAAVQRFADTLPAAPSSAQNLELTPALVLARAAELSRWQQLVQHVAVAGSSTHNAAELAQLVSHTQVNARSPWALPYTRLGWALGDAVQGRALWPLLSDLAYQWLAQLDNSASPWRAVATELTWQQAKYLAAPALIDYEGVLGQSRALLLALTTYRPVAVAPCDELVAAVAMLTPAL
ncbi:hypothetical protein LPJ73_006909, partial [Coemansia sp. RSA 2703]